MIYWQCTSICTQYTKKTIFSKSIHLWFGNLVLISVNWHQITKYICWQLIQKKLHTKPLMNVQWLERKGFRLYLYVIDILIKDWILLESSILYSSCSLRHANTFSPAWLKTSKLKLHKCVMLSLMTAGAMIIDLKP